MSIVCSFSSFAEEKSAQLGEKPVITTVHACATAVSLLLTEKLIAVDCEWAGEKNAIREQELCVVQVATAKKEVNGMDSRDVFRLTFLISLLEELIFSRKGN